MLKKLLKKKTKDGANESCGEDLPILSNKENGQKKRIGLKYFLCFVAIVLSFVCVLILLKVIMFVGEGLSNMGDAMVSIDLIAFLDENTNGVRDVGEPPLKDVPFFFDIKSPSLNKIETATSDQNGEAHISELINARDLRYGTLKVYTEIPPGYKITTPSIYTINYGDDINNNITYYFGFVGKPEYKPTP